MFIYAIVNFATLKIYIGQHKGSNLQSYLKQKLSHARRGESKNSHIYSAMRISPAGVWSIHALVSDVATREELDALERHYIRVLKTQHPDVGYNLGDGGEGGNATGRVLSTITKAKISAAHQGLKHTAESIAKMSAVHQEISSKLKGIPRSPEATAALRSPEVRARALANTIATNKGKLRSPDFCAKVSAGKRKEWATRENRKHSLDSRRKISDTMKGRAPMAALRSAHSAEAEAKRQNTRFIKTVAYG